MSEAPEWTAGPWLAEDDEHGVCKTIVDTHGFPIALEVAPDDAHLIAASPCMAEEFERHDLEGLWRFLGDEFRADPDTGEAVTADIRPHWDALCDYMAAREKMLAKARGESK